MKTETNNDTNNTSQNEAQPAPKTKSVSMKKIKTWQRTNTPGLYLHKNGSYYGRVYHKGGRNKFISLKTDKQEIARIRFFSEKSNFERRKKALANAENGAALMGDFAAILKEQIKARAGISENTRKAYLEHVDYVEKTWPGFALLRPDAIKPNDIEDWRNRALKAGTGYMPPGSKKKDNAVKGNSGGRFNKAVDALRKILDMAHAQGLINYNHAAKRGIKARVTPRQTTPRACAGNGTSKRTNAPCERKARICCGLTGTKKTPPNSGKPTRNSRKPRRRSGR